MRHPYRKRFMCAKCGYTGIPSPGNLCPRCGKRPEWFYFSKAWGITAMMPLLLLAGALVYIHYFHPRIAAELSSMAERLPTRFHIGIDVSASINQDALEKLKDILLIRLDRLTKRSTVSYQISTFGNPGCGLTSISTVVDLAAPGSRDQFARTVKPALESITVAPIAPRKITPLTTPFYCFLETVLDPQVNKRIIIFSDLINDDSDCPEQYVFPEAAIKHFSANNRGEIIFLYTSPRTGDDPELKRRLLSLQKTFIDRMNALALGGKVRIFFRRIPDDPLKSLRFIQNELQRALPANFGDHIRDRFCRILFAVLATITADSDRLAVSASR